MAGKTLSSPKEDSITSNDFLKIRDYFYRKTGIYFEESKRYFFDKRILERMQKTHHETFEAYFIYLRFEEQNEELQHLINTLTINETYFYREDYQLQSLTKNILSEVVGYKKNKEPIRIWSIPCATGEEPYSIAIYLLENWNLLKDYDIQIFASDIDTGVIETAKQGIYSWRSIKNLPPSVIEKYFSKIKSDAWQLDSSLRGIIDFQRTNLIDTNLVHRFVNIDVVFCRNLLIYFDDLSRRQAAESLFECMSPGGFICLGHSESMSRISTLFNIRKFPDAIVYQKSLR